MTMEALSKIVVFVSTMLAVLLIIQAIFCSSCPELEDSVSSKYQTDPGSTVMETSKTGCSCNDDSSLSSLPEQHGSELKFPGRKENLLTLKNIEPKDVLSIADAVASTKELRYILNTEFNDDNNQIASGILAPEYYAHSSGLRALAFSGYSEFDVASLTGISYGGIGAVGCGCHDEDGD